MFYYDYYSLVVLVPLMILSLIIQGKMNSTYKKYSKITNSKNTTGAEIARFILKSAGITDVTIEMVPGNLSDHFDPTKKVIRLSQQVFCGNTVSALGVAAHETGHAIQYAQQYRPIVIRSAVVGITNFSSKLIYPLILCSFIFAIPLLCDIAVLCFAVLFFFQLITLPVEFNASTRAVRLIENMGYSDSDVSGTKKVLSAAAMTYVAAMIYSLGQLVVFFMRTRRDD